MEKDKNRLLEISAKESLEKAKTLEKQKQLDDMAIAGFKGIKEELTKEIVKLNQNLKTLKLDLLAEKQLRRIHQTSLHSLDPQNENYNIANIIFDENKHNEIKPKYFEELNGPSSTIVPFWKLSCEAKPANINFSESFSYIIPSKIQKGQPVKTSNDKLHTYRLQRSLWSKSEKKSIGFQFRTPENGEPSTSAFVPNKNPSQNRAFGERFSFFNAVTNPTGNSATNGFNFSIDNPSFPSTSQNMEPSTSSANKISFGYSNYRNQKASSTSTPNNHPHLNGEGPKISDR